MEHVLYITLSVNKCYKTHEDTEHFRLNKHPRMGDLVSAGCRAM